ncbi:oligosaccharide flippase family protein [Enterobacter sp. UPMP2052]
MSNKNKTFKDFLNYFLGDLFVKGFMFISLPLLSRIMSPEDYGRMSLINSAVMILYVFISLNLQNAVINAYMKNDVDFPVYLGTILWGLTAAQLILVAICIYFAAPLGVLLSISKFDVYWVVTICILLSYIYIYTSYLQGARLSSGFVKLNIVSKVSEVLVIFVFAWFLTKDKYLAKVYAQLVVSIILLIYVVMQLKKIAIFKFNIRYFVSALAFSSPLIIHVLSNALLSQVDRLFIAKMLGEAQAGIYSFAYNIGMCVLVVVMAWNSSWQPKLYKLLDANDNEKIIKIINKSSILMLVISFLTILFSKYMVEILADDRYRESITVVPIILIGNSFIHIYLSYVNFTFYKKKTVLVSIGTLLAVTINISLNYLLIPKYGIHGAAWATVIAYLMLAFFHYLIATKILKSNPVSCFLLLWYSAILLASYFFVIYLDSLPLWFSLVSKAIICIVIFIIVMKTRIHNELKE